MSFLFLVELFCDREKDEVLNFDDKMLVTEKQQEPEKTPATEESKENKEGATNEAEEKEEDKVSFYYMHDFGIAALNYFMAQSNFLLLK